GVHDEHRLNGTSTQSAMLLRYVERRKAEIGELLPQRWAPAVLGGGNLAAGLEAVMLANEALHRIREKLLLVCKGEVHGLTARLGIRNGKERARLLTGRESSGR